jgi:glutamine synthetase
MGMININEIFGINVFDDAKMSERLPCEIYLQLKKTMELGVPLEAGVADVVANAMKDWAIERGATHYTHWFQPLNGVTAEKHDSFLTPTKNGVITKLSGKNLIKGEPDASSFPSGGIRATFEARGYTIWDCTSPAFLKEDNSGITLCIPTAFYSYTSDALDKKTPLLRSMEALNIQTLRVLKALGNTTATHIYPSVGAEQEYFLIDKSMYQKRKDLIFTGRTLFGAPAPKGQEMEDHYFGPLKEKVSAFMNELDIELWKMGVTAKTKHNEVAPCQHELAPVFITTNIATDHNQLIMETLKRVADRHNLVCLLHEKPFAGVNGSGKHNNWSIDTNDGQNLFEPGKTPHENMQFLLFLVSAIKAVSKYADLVRASAANAGNDHRLGAAEAPPAIISMYLGDELVEILDAIENGSVLGKKEGEFIRLGVNTLPEIRKDSTDRNRTSPFAFTGNKFEFRMVPSSASISTPNVIINTIIADVLEEIANRLEVVGDSKSEIENIIKEFYKEHKKIIFDGNGYSDEWVKEAERRGIPNITNTVDALRAYTTEKNKSLLIRHKVMSENEIASRYEIYTELYYKSVNIEAKTMAYVTKKDIMPAVLHYIGNVSKFKNEAKNAGLDTTVYDNLLDKLNTNTQKLEAKLILLEEVMINAQKENETYKKACAFRDEVSIAMVDLRAAIDYLETIVERKFWPMPTYSDILYYI